MNWYLTAIKKYINFGGRARRKEYWYFFLFNILISLVLCFIDITTGNYDPETGYGLLSSIYALAVFIPGITVGVRRLHDTGRTGWWSLIAFVPLIGILVLLCFCASKGDTGRNQYGSDPKEFDF
ncbi:membrane protein [Vibrio harveyi]|uniref:DUF805 domain-containing protein n=1 Tax=Vibrio harveyi TaxID=669 RepID=UPI000539576D|nr:DUF805 domain-containing protein [Vibrio harveyi]AIV05671.1 membrane protein [Vibrio harveyi]CAK6715334.1 conserved membrane hypothetical protein [Vibrio harveyi]